MSPAQPEPWDYWGALPGQAQLPLAPQYWIGNAEKFRHHPSAARWFNGAVEALMSRRTSDNEDGFNLVVVVEKVEQMVPQLPDGEAKTTMVALHVLWQRSAAFRWPHALPVVAIVRFSAGRSVLVVKTRGLRHSRSERRAAGEGGFMSCHNRADDLLADALSLPSTSSELLQATKDMNPAEAIAVAGKVGDVVMHLMEPSLRTAAAAILAQSTTANLVAAMKPLPVDATNKVVGDIGEATMRMLAEDAGHLTVHVQDPREKAQRREANDLTTVSPEGVLTVHDSKATRKGEMLTHRRPGELPTPRLGNTRRDGQQLADQYNIVRLNTFGPVQEDVTGDAPIALVTAVNLQKGLCQTFQVVSRDGKTEVGDPVGPPQECGVEIVLATTAVLEGREADLFD